MANGISDFESQLKNNMQSSFDEVQANVANQQMNSTIAETMRSFKDQMSFNLQSLNLTLSTLSSSMNNLGSKIGGLTPNVAGRYIDSGLQPGAFLGNISRDYANAQGQFMGQLGAFVGNSAFVNRPYNINPMEFYTGAQMQRDFYGAKLAGNVLSGVVGALTPGSTLTTMALSGLWQGTHSYLDTGDMIRRMSGRFGSSPMGTDAALSVSRGIQRLGFNEMMRSTAMDNRLGYSGYKDIAALGLQGDLFHGRSPDELLKQVKEAGKVVKLLTGVLGSQDVQEAMQSLTQMKNMGLNLSQTGGSQFAKSLVQNSFGYGWNNSMTSGQMLNAGMQIAQAGLGTNGIPAAVGVQQGMKNLAYVSEMRKRGLLSDTDIAAGGGEQSIAARMMGVNGSILNSGFGYSVMAAGLTGTGGFNANMAYNTLRGGGVVGTVGGAIGNLMGGRGFFANSANMMVNRNDMLASLALQDPNALQNITDTTLRLQMQFNPIYNSQDMMGKRNLLAQHLMLNQGMESGSAKAMASRIVDPSVSRQIEYLNKASQSRAAIDRSRVYNSFGAQFSRTFIDPIEKIGEEYIVQPFVEFGENISNFFKRADPYRDLGNSIRSGEDLIYSSVLDKNGRATGIKRAKSVEEIINSGIFTPKKDTSAFMDNPYDSSQYQRALNNVTGGGTGTLGRSTIAKLWNAPGRLFGGIDHEMDQQTFSKVLLAAKKANANAFDLMTNGARSGERIQGATGVNALLKSIQGDEDNDFLINNVISDYSLRELGGDAENNPFALSMAILRRTGARSATATQNMYNRKVSKDLQNEANRMLSGTQATVNNLTPFDSGSIMKTVSGYMNKLLSDGYSMEDVTAAIAQAEGTSGFKLKGSLQETGYENAMALAGTKGGRNLVDKLGSNYMSTKRWRVQEFLEGSGSLNLANDVLSDREYNSYSKMRSLTKNSKHIGSILNALNGQMGEGARGTKNFVSYSAYLDPDNQDKLLELIQQTTGLKGDAATAELENLNRLMKEANGDFSLIKRAYENGNKIDVANMYASFTGGKLSGNDFLNAMNKAGSYAGGMLRMAHNYGSLYTELYGGDSSKSDAAEAARNKILKAAGVKTMSVNDMDRLAAFWEETSKANGGGTKTFEEKVKASGIKLGENVNFENLSTTIKGAVDKAQDQILQKNKLDEEQLKAQNKEALKQSVKSAIDSTVADVNGKKVVLVIDAVENIKSIKDDRKNLDKKIEQVSAQNLGIMDKLLGKSDKVIYTDGKA